MQRVAHGKVSSGSTAKRRIESVNDFQKRGLDVGQARRMVNDKNEPRGYVRGYEP